MQRSLIERSLSIVDLPDSFKLTIPDIIQSDLGFENSKYSTEDVFYHERNAKTTHPGKNKFYLTKHSLIKIIIH
jgi:hypothetical protein